MGQGRKASRRQATGQRQSRQWRRLAWVLVLPGAIVALLTVVLLTGQPGYSGFEVIGTQPTVVFVFLPG
jgi:hypothetical protein